MCKSAFDIAARAAFSEHTLILVLAFLLGFFSAAEQQIEDGEKQIQYRDANQQNEDLQ